MALPLLLLRAASSSVVKSAAKNVAKKTIKNKAKDFIRGKGKKKSSARMGEDKSNVNVRASTSLVPIRKLDQTSNDLDSSTTEISKTNSTSNFGGIENQLNSIVNLTSSLNSLVLEQYNKKNKSSQREKLQREKLKKREREESQEKKISGSGIVRGVTSKAKEFNILGAIFNFLLGAGLLRLIDLFKGGVDESGKPVGPLKSLSDGLRSFQKLFYGFKLAKGAIGSLVSALGSAFKAIPNVLKSFVGVATKGISNLGRTVSNGFKGLLGSNGRIVKYFKELISKGTRAASLATKLTGIDTRSAEVKNARKALDKVGRFGGSLDSTRFMRGSGGRSTLSTATPGFTDPSRYRAPSQARAGGFQLEQARKALGVSPDPSKAGRLSGGIGGSSLTSRGLQNVPGRLATRVIGRGGRESLRGISRIVKSGMKFGGRALSRIPIMGPLIVLVANILDPEVKTVSQAVYRSLGSMAGGAIGAALVGGATVGFGAILGGIAGQIIGEYLGDLLYIGVNGGGFGKVSKKIQNDISHALTKGAEYAGMVRDWAGKGFERLYEGLPKIGPIRPNWIPLIGGKEIPTPIFPLLLGSAVLNIPKAFFSDDPMKDSEVKKPKEETKKETTPSTPDLSTSTSSSSSAAPLSGTNLDKAKKMHDYIVSKGYTSAQSKGIVANIERESTFNPTARSGDDKGPGGLFQWKGSRQTSTVASLVNSGDWKGQIDYALTEDVGPRYKSETANMNAFDASMWWAKYWERPLSLQNARNKHNSFLPRYNFGGGGAQSQQPVQLASQQSQTVTTQGTINDMYKGGANTSQFPISSPYGKRTHPITGQKGSHHSGVDIAPDPPRPGYYVGLKVPGKVTRVDFDAGNPRGYGHFVIISSQETGMSYMFAHLAKVMVKMDEIYTGQPIGEIGNTGGSTGIHLHYEVYKGGKNGPEVDPTPYINLLTIGKIDGQIRQQKMQVSPNQQLSNKVTPSTLSSNDISRSSTSLNNEILEQYAEYENDMGGVNFIPVPVGGGEQANMMIGGGEAGMMMVAGSSPESMVNNWWKSQFLGFLYKQG